MAAETHRQPTDSAHAVAPLQESREARITAARMERIR